MSVKKTKDRKQKTKDRIFNSLGNTSLSLTLACGNSSLVQPLTYPSRQRDRVAAFPLVPLFPRPSLLTPSPLFL